MARRTRYDIYLEVLDTIRRRGVSGITRISYGANLPVDRARALGEYAGNMYQMYKHKSLGIN